jgi:hypothetical protein
MDTYLMLGSGLFWTITYLLIIWRGIHDHSYGMPLVALCANISWEFIFSFVFPSHGVQRFVNIIWFLLDTGILATFLRFGRSEFAKLSKTVISTMFGLTLVTSFCVILFITMNFHDRGAYSAFGQNLMMSVLFIVMLYRRQSLRGQAISIAICKLIGTLLASLAFYLYSSLSHQSILLPFLYIAIFVYDLIYLGMTISYTKSQKKANLEHITNNEHSALQNVG